MTTVSLVRNWWMMAIRGAFAIMFGLSILLWADGSLPLIVVLFGVYAMIDGAWAVAAAIRASQRRFEAWPVALEGLASVAVGILALVWPFVAREFIYFIAAWGSITGALEALAAGRLPREAAGHWFLGTGSACSLFLAVLILLLPHADTERVAIVIAIYGFAFGVLVSLAAFRFRAITFTQ